MLPVWLGVAVLVLGVGGSIIWFITGAVGLVNRINDLPRMAVPGRATLELTEGAYRIYAEYSGATSDSGPADDLGPISVTDSSNQPVTVSGVDIQETYSVGPHNGRLVASFDAPANGSYTIAIADAGGVNGSSVSGMDLAVSKGPALFSSSNLATFGFALLLGARQRAGGRHLAGGRPDPSQPLAPGPDGDAGPHLDAAGTGPIRRPAEPGSLRRPAEPGSLRRPAEPGSLRRPAEPGP